jgi:hypothetical protein
VSGFENAASNTRFNVPLTDASKHNARTLHAEPF